MITLTQFNFINTCCPLLVSGFTRGFTRCFTDNCLSNNCYAHLGWRREQILTFLIEKVGSFNSFQAEKLTGGLEFRTKTQMNTMFILKIYIAFIDYNNKLDKITDFQMVLAKVAMKS